MRGFTLIETLVVIGIISILSLIGINTIVEFQKRSILSNSGQEFISSLKIAKSKSLAGELLPGENDETFESDGLPRYGVKVFNNSYTLFREYKLKGDLTVQRQDLETSKVDLTLSLVPNLEILFNRQTGFTSPVVFSLSRVNSTSGKEIDINSQGLITIKDI
ncbi:MAG: prepilin-type N-terminal cleavage/methylation domain-containing protein [Patescibacteria group bacterium]